MAHNWANSQQTLDGTFKIIQTNHLIEVKSRIVSIAKAALPNAIHSQVSGRLVIACVISTLLLLMVVTATLAHQRNNASPVNLPAIVAVSDNTRTPVSSSTTVATTESAQNPASLLVAGKVTSGVVTALLLSSPSDPIGQGLGNITLEGNAKLSFSQGILNISLNLEDNISWTFAFYAADLQQGTLYSNAVLLPVPDPQTPGIVIVKNGERCREADGEFTVEQASPRLIVSFVQRCDKKASKSIRGTITFTPANLFTPTPTLSAERVLLIL